MTSCEVKTKSECDWNVGNKPSLHKKSKEGMFGQSGSEKSSVNCSVWLQYIQYIRIFAESKWEVWYI